MAADLDNIHFLEIDRDTRVICHDTNKALKVLVMRVAKESPPVPDGTALVDSVYKLTGNYTLSSCGHSNTPHRCSDASFAPPLDITLSYNDDDIPQYVHEDDICIAYYAATAENWVPLTSQVDTQDNMVTAPVSHFTTFSIVGAAVPPTPANASIDNMDL